MAEEADGQGLQGTGRPTRRLLLDRLREDNGQTLGQLCEHLEMARQSVTQHLSVLESANLVSTVRRGRLKLHYLNPVPLHEIQDRWIQHSNIHGFRRSAEAKSRAEETEMTATDKPTFVYVTYIHSTPEKVWEALTDADLTAQYWGHSNVSDWRPGFALGASAHRRLGNRGRGGRGDRGGAAAARDRVRSPTKRVSPSVVRFDIEPHHDIVRLTVTHDDIPDRSTTRPPRRDGRRSCRTSSRCWKPDMSCRRRRGRCTPSCGPNRCRAGGTVTAWRTCRTPIMFRDDDLDLAEVRKIALGFPEAFEKISEGRPVFFVSKIFVMYRRQRQSPRPGRVRPVPLLDHGQGRRERPQGARSGHSVLLPRRTWVRRAGSGWISPPTEVDWDEVRELIDASFRMVAPKKLIRQLDEALTRRPAGRGSIGGTISSFETDSVPGTPRRRENGLGSPADADVFLGPANPYLSLGAGARPGRVTHCCFEHAGQNFGSLDRGPQATRPVDVGCGWRTRTVGDRRRTGPVPEEIPDAEHELVIERVAAIDVAKASGMVCVRVPAGRRRRSAGCGTWRPPPARSATWPIS